jgi:uncharacterized protein involved in exopolysaccharide biosynthesis
MSGPGGNPAGGARRLPIASFLEVVARNRNLIVAVAVCAGIAAVIAGFIVPTTYETTVTILPPEQSGGGLGSLAGGLQSSLAILQMGLAQIATSDLYADMVKSRSVLRYTIDRLDLLRVFGFADMDSLRAYAYAMDQLDKDVSVTTSNNGLITLTVRAHTGYLPSKKDKQDAQRRVATLGNALAEGLESVNRQKNTSQARQTRIYLEQQVALTEERLEKAGTELSLFQSGHMAIDIGEQMRSAIETAGTLQGELLARQIALGVALQSMQPGNPEVQRLESEVAQVRRQLKDLQRGTRTPAGGAVPTDALEMGLEEMPELGRAYAKLLREVKIQETLYELLTAQLYQARIQETQDMPVIQVLDEATVPAFKKSPVIRKIGIVAGLLGLAAGLLIAYLREWWGLYPGREQDAAVLRRIFALRGR